MPYTSLFIDLDDTIWNFSQNARDSFEEVYHLFSFERYFDSFDQFFAIYIRRNDELWAEYASGEIKKEELNTLRFSYPLETVGIFNQELVKNYSDQFFAIIPTKSKLMPHAREAVEYLADKYNLYILSNGFRELQSRKMQSAGIDQYFKKIILSEDILVMKPYPEIFHFALSATQSHLKESLMIGDNFKADITGARGVGMSQLFYNPTKQGNLSFQPTYMIHSWEEIKTVL